SDYLKLGEGEMKSGGFRRPSILSDALEAVFGAVSIDGGVEAAHRVIASQSETLLGEVDPISQGKAAKRLHQERPQAMRLDLPLDTVVATHGAAHNQLFEVACDVPRLDIRVQAAGSSRRAAEQSAAQLALERLDAIEGSGGGTRRRKRGSQLRLPVALNQDHK